MTDLTELSLVELAEQFAACALNATNGKYEVAFRNHEERRLVAIEDEFRRRDTREAALVRALRDIVEHPAAFSDGASRLWTQAQDALAAYPENVNG